MLLSPACARNKWREGHEPFVTNSGFAAITRMPNFRLLRRDNPATSLRAATDQQLVVAET